MGWLWDASCCRQQRRKHQGCTVHRRLHAQWHHWASASGTLPPINTDTAPIRASAVAAVRQLFHKISDIRYTRKTLYVNTCPRTLVFLRPCAHPGFFTLLRTWRVQLTLAFVMARITHVSCLSRVVFSCGPICAHLRGAVCGMPQARSMICRRFQWDGKSACILRAVVPPHPPDHPLQ